MMGEPREILIGIDYYQIGDDTVNTTNNRPQTVREWYPVRDGYADAVREVARLQDENRRIREEGIRDAMQVLFNECVWLWGYERGAMILYYPPGFVLPMPNEEQIISRTEMADALTDALLPLVP
jgi:hypothetical protein